MRAKFMALAVAIALPLMLPHSTASAQAMHRAHVRHEVQDVRQAQRALQQDVRQRQLYAAQGNRAGVAKETREIKHDKRQLAREKRDVARVVRRHRR